jgi:hypothetical protein
MNTFVYTCDRCREFSVGGSYRVVSDSDGERLLDMVVCYGCYLEASQLGLETEPVEVEHVVLH